MPGIALHEFETWVIAAALDHSELLGEQAPAQRLSAIAKEFHDDVELIDDGPRTAPSKRVAGAWPGYSKTIDGINIIRDVGLEQVLSKCPTLQDWLERLTAPPR